MDQAIIEMYLNSDIFEPKLWNEFYNEASVHCFLSTTSKFCFAFKTHVMLMICKMFVMLDLFCGQSLSVTHMSIQKNKPAYLLNLFVFVNTPE